MLNPSVIQALPLFAGEQIVASLDTFGLIKMIIKTFKEASEFFHIQTLQPKYRSRTKSCEEDLNNGQLFN